MIVGVRVRKSEKRDLSAIMGIFAHAREFMVSYGNTHQWSEYGWPPIDLIEKDIELGRGYVIVDGEEILATFCYMQGLHADPCYDHIEQGEWGETGEYGAIHRIASSGKRKGMLAIATEFALSKCPLLRMDTHEDNAPMRHLMEALGFSYRGIVHVPQDDAPRLAYEKKR